MSIHNRYAHVPLTDEDFTSFDTQFALIKEIMSALPEVDGKILRRVAKLGFKSDTFTRDTLMIAAQHEELLPRGLDVQELEAQVRLRDELRSRALQMKRMARDMEQVVQLLGSDVFSGALAAYKSMKANHRGTLEEQLRELGRLFRRRKKQQQVEEHRTGDGGQIQPVRAELSSDERDVPRSSGLEQSPKADHSAKALPESGSAVAQEGQQGRLPSRVAREDRGLGDDGCSNEAQSSPRADSVSQTLATAQGDCPREKAGRRRVTPRVGT